jgi:hypothetical protein
LFSSFVVSQLLSSTSSNKSSLKLHFNQSGTHLFEFESSSSITSVLSCFSSIFSSFSSLSKLNSFFSSGLGISISVFSSHQEISLKTSPSSSSSLFSSFISQAREVHHNISSIHSIESGEIDFLDFSAMRFTTEYHTKINTATQIIHKIT